MPPKPQGHLCGPKIYEFEGWLFEINASSGPWPLTKDFLLRKRAGDRFYDMFSRFYALDDDEKKRYFVGGGCRSF